MRTLEQAIIWYDGLAKDAGATGFKAAEENNRQLSAWLCELQDRRAEPEIVECYECKHYMPVSQTSNSWGKCSIHSSPTEKQRTCQSCDYCSWAERRTE